MVGWFMCTITKLTVPAEQFALSAAPEMIVEIERVIAHSPKQIVPCFWASGGNYDQFETAAKEDPSVNGLQKLDEVENAILYKANWIEDVESVIHAYTESGARLLGATGRKDHWELQLRFDTVDDVTQFNNYIDENDLTVELQRLYEPSHPTSIAPPTLTDTQRETIIVRLRSGYYKIPRETSTGELAERFGISHQALSNRF